MRSRPRPASLGPALMVILAIPMFLPATAQGRPVAEGLVLWLDADNADTLTRDANGYVSQWADRSGKGNHAKQSNSTHKPRYEPKSLGGRSVVRFDGNDFLNLGQPASLNFKPGQAFTIAVVYNKPGRKMGTFVSKGGGSANQRAYQFYVTPTKLGAITHGVMRENEAEPGARFAAKVCDGSRSDVFLDGKCCLSFDAGKRSARTNVDVLIGARRKDADNTGTYYMLTGDVAEILIYRRALSDKELAGLGSYVNEKYALNAKFQPPDDPKQIAALMNTPAGFARLDVVAGRLIKKGNRAPAILRSLMAEPSPNAPLATAELLGRLARQNHLSAESAELAVELFKHEDPFVRGMAEWAVAMKVGGENNTQEAVWPGTKPPAWFKVWSNLPHEFLLEADWVRQAVALGIHRNPKRLLESVNTMIDRVDRMLPDYRASGATAETIREATGQLEALRSIRDKLGEKIAKAPTDRLAQHRLWIEARRTLRTIVMANPKLDFDRIVCIKQFAPHTVRNITRSYAWKHKPGGDICILSDWKSAAQPREVLAGRLGPGYVWGIDLWWNADRMVFGYARQPNWPPNVNTTNYGVEGRNVFQLRKVHEPIHLFQVRVDGTELEQLTDDPYWSDFEPTYCADGQVVFSSDRCGRSAECGNVTYDHTNPNLYIMSPDGSNIRHLTDNKDIDRYPHSLDDGRIAYTHWEYQERHFMEVHAIWTVRPDGRMSDTLFKHHMRAPCGLRDTRSIPGSSKLVSIATGHHTFAYGPVVVVDPAGGLNNDAGISIVTPGVRPQEGAMAGVPVAEGGVPDRGGLYHTPWALGEKCFLASYAYARPNCTAPAGVDSNGFGLYLIDSHGNRELIHRDAIYSCTFPIPLRKRLPPPRLPGIDKTPQHYATCYVTNVYDGMEGVPRGTIKFIRVSQHVGWPFDARRGAMDYIPGTAGAKHLDFQSWSPVRVIGDVPVESDGSASFQVPADTAVYFQALDARHMEILRMRSMVSFKAGEVRGCRGCHESQAAAPAAAPAVPAALRSPPQVPTPPPWGAQKMLGYEWLIQPILDHHCVRCHGNEEPDGRLDFTAVRASDGLYQSFRTMFGILPQDKKTGRVLVSCSNRFSNADVSRPMEFGSHKSPLVTVLLEDQLHKKEVELSQTEWFSLVTWIDANAPYHDAFFNKRPADGGEPRREVVPDLSALPASPQDPAAPLVESRP